MYKSRKTGTVTTYDIESADYVTGGTITVEDWQNAPPATCGGGTEGAHQRESVFDTELVTGFVNSGAPNSLSVTTAASVGAL